MSYLSEFKAKRITAQQLFSKSAGWLARSVGLDDKGVDDAVAAADKATDEAILVVSASIFGLIKRSFPMIPAATAAVIAERVATAAMEQVDTAISAVGAFVKERN